MRKMTQSNLEDAFAGESQAHMRYLIFADVAEKEGKINLARLFRAIAYAEQIHATNHYRELGKINDSVKNLDIAIAGENFEVEEMYPVYNNVASFQNEKGAVRSTHYAWETEKVHEKMYRKAQDMANQGKDIDVGKIFICPVCGYTIEGELPNYRPVCNTKKELFKNF